MAAVTQAHRPPRIIYRDAHGRRSEATYVMIGKLEIVERQAPIDLADGIGWKRDQVVSMYARGLWDVKLGGSSVIITGLTKLGRQVLADYNEKYPKE